MTESKQRPDAVAVANGGKSANGVLTPSTASSFDDNGANAWSTPGLAAFDFRSASPLHASLLLTPLPSLVLLLVQGPDTDLRRRYRHVPNRLNAPRHSKLHPPGRRV